MGSCCILENIDHAWYNGIYLYRLMLIPLIAVHWAWALQYASHYICAFVLVTQDQRQILLYDSGNRQCYPCWLTTGENSAGMTGCGLYQSCFKQSDFDNVYKKPVAWQATWPLKTCDVVRKENFMRFLFKIDFHSLVMFNGLQAF